MSNVDIDTAREFGIDCTDPIAALDHLERVAGDLLDFEGSGCTDGRCRHCEAAAARHLHATLVGMLP